MFIHHIKIGGIMNKNKCVSAELYSLVIQPQLNNMAKHKVIYLNKI